MLLGILAQGPAALAEEILSAEPAVQAAEPDEAQPAASATGETASPEAEFPADEEPAEENAPELLEEAVPAEEETETEEETTGAEQAPENTAEVAVTLLTGLPLQGNADFTVSLNGPEAQTQSVTLPASEGSEPARREVRFRDLPQGQYTLTVQGSGFATYTQTLEVGTQLYSVQLYTGFLAGYTYTADSLHPGALRIGDVDGDGQLTDGDASVLIDAIEGGQAGVADLDRSGAADLVDLQMLAASLEETGDGTASVLVRVPESLMALEKEESTQVVSGSLEDLLTGDSAVALKPADGAAISEENPVTVSFDFEKAAKAAVPMAGMVLQTPPAAENAVSGATVLVEYEEDGETKTMPITVGGSLIARFLGAATVQPDGSIAVDFGGQIAVKKVTIKITAVSGGGSLAEISQVEFLNDMESRIPPPSMDIPTGLAAETESQAFTLTWDPAVNVTGYEVEIAFDGKTEMVRTAANTLAVNSFGGEKLQNSKTYTVRVQSVNGGWRSGYSEAITVVPKADKLPAAPDALRLTGRFQRIEASWKDMKDTDSYNVYYRKQGDADFTKVAGIDQNSYTIQNLENNTVYEVYVTGVNELGEGPASLTSTASTANVSPVKLPAYRLINTVGAAGEVTAHIASVPHEAGYMKDSPLDSGKTAWGVVDNDFTSWYGLDDWDDGAAYPDNGGVRITFDARYHIGSLSLSPSEDRGTYGNVRLFARGEDGREYQVPGVTIAKHSDGSQNYYTIKIPGGVTTDYLRICVGYIYNNRPISISEMRFYTYDSLEDDILALYADDLHVTLRDGVNEQTIEALQTRLDTPDEASGELHPEREALQKELDNARGLLTTALSDVVEVHTAITAKKDGHLGFTGLNAWQPLGVTARAGEEIIVYVGSSNVATGANAWLQLVATQYNSESGEVVSQPIQLKVGRNEIMVPELVTFDAEHGGALYVQYTGNSANDRYSVRVSGGETIPVLDLYGIDDPAQRKERVTAYVAALEAAAGSLNSRHDELHGDHGAYEAETCILNTTDVLLDQMMYSVPVSQLLAGLGSGSTADKAARLLSSVDAMDQMMVLFYQHKGLTDLAGAGDKNRLPSQHLNVRYMRMFAGAFMYAAGNHIGIGWDSVPGLGGGEPIALNEDGSYRSGDLFGWGIAHEIGHNINQSSYAVAEVTNNYFSQISQAHEGVRFGYDAIYSKVTSGTTGHSSDVFTQLGLYWQLHLAYDKGYEYEIYSNYDELFASRFYARVDTYARNTAQAPAPGGVQLTLGRDADQNFMRLASAAARKDLTDFFVRWGMMPDAATAAYLAQFEPETRALYYGNDASRNYRFTHSESSSFAGKTVLADSTAAVLDERTPNQVNLTLGCDAGDLLLGYEIARISWENGQAKTEVVGFTTGSHYTDTITTVNNRTIAYQITAVDQFLNRSQPMTLPAVKISHDGSYDKSLWTVTTNMTSDDDTTPDAGEQDPCEPEPVSAIHRVVDNNKNTTYTGRADGEAVITLNFGKTLAVTGLKYTVTGGTPIRDYEIQIPATEGGWQTLATGTFTGGEISTVYFRNENNDPWVCTYDAAQLRLVVKAPAGEISVSELDVLGPTGDNVELLSSGIGTLSAPYVYEESTGQAIPEGSLVFTGSYKGNPAYNVVLLYDENGNVVGGVDAEGSIVAHQIILAPDPQNGQLGEVSEGYWVYWIEPQDLEGMTMPETVRVELYRVDNATTNEGQRLTSDTLAVTMPDPLPSLTMGSQAD